MRVHNLGVRFPEEPCSIQRMPGSDNAQHGSAMKPDYQSQPRPNVRLKMRGCCQAGKDKMRPCEESSWRDDVLIAHPVTECGTLKSYTDGIVSSQASVLPVGNPLMGSQCHYLFHHGCWVMPRGCPRLHLGEDICTPIFVSCTGYILGCSHHTDRCVRI